MLELLSLSVVLRELLPLFYLWCSLSLQPHSFNSELTLYKESNCSTPLLPQDLQPTPPPSLSAQ